MFIYVMDLDSKELLEKHGYKLVKADERRGVFVFENKANMEFSLEVPCVVSDMLTF